MNYFKISRFFLYLIPFSVAIVSKGTLFPFIVGKYAYLRSVTAVALIVFLLGLLLDEKADVYIKRLKSIFKNPLVIVVSAFLSAFVLAGFFGIDPDFSFWSNFERGEGGLQMLFLFSFFVMLASLFTKKEHWQTLFWAFIASAYLMILYGVGAGFNLEGFLGPEFNTENLRFQGSIGNPAYVAVYLIFTSFFASKLLITEKSKKSLKSTILWISLVVFAIFFILAATRGAFLGLGAGIFAGLVYLGFSKKSWRKPVFGTVLILALLFSLGVYFQDSPVVDSLPGSRIFDISLDEKTFQHRMIMWGIAWDTFKEYPVFGVGPENYLDMFIEKYDPSYFTPEEGYGAWFDRAHSIVFDYLAETGILGFLSYASIFVIMFWQITKTRVKEVKEKVMDEWSPVAKALVIGLPVAYLVQGLALFDVSTTYIPLFTFLAFMVYKLDFFNKDIKNHA